MRAALSGAGAGVRLQMMDHSMMGDNGGCIQSSQGIRSDVPSTASLWLVAPFFGRASRALDRHAAAFHPSIVLGEHLRSSHDQNRKGSVQSRVAVQGI
jgi:hypothetical protein